MVTATISFTFPEENQVSGEKRLKLICMASLGYKNDTEAIAFVTLVLTLGPF